MYIFFGFLGPSGWRSDRVWATARLRRESVLQLTVSAEILPDSQRVPLCRPCARGCCTAGKKDGSGHLPIRAGAQAIKPSSKPFNSIFVGQNYGIRLVTIFIQPLPGSICREKISVHDTACQWRSELASPLTPASDTVESSVVSFPLCCGFARRFTGFSARCENSHSKVQKPTALVS
jgi:hypothetical protein